MTRAEIIASIQAKGFGTDSAASQEIAVNSVYRRINGMRRWAYLERRSTALVTIVGQSSVSLATIPALMWVDAVRAEFGTDYYALGHKPKQELRDLLNYDRDTGTPLYWTEAAGEVHIYPKPDRAYTVVLDYITTPADLAADADVPVFDSTYHDILAWGAVVELAFRARDWNAMQQAREEYREILRQMTASYGMEQRQSTLEVGRA